MKGTFPYIEFFSFQSDQQTTPIGTNIKAALFNDLLCITKISEVYQNLFQILTQDHSKLAHDQREVDCLRW